MDKGYKEFVEELQQKLKAITGLEENDMFFEEKGGLYTPTGDRLFVTVHAWEGGREICGVFTEELYRFYAGGKSMDEIIQKVTAELNETKKGDYLEKMRNIMNYRQIKENLMIRPLNKDVHEKELETAVYRTVGDIALVLYLKLGNNGNGVVSIKIRQEYMEHWEAACGVERDKVFADTLVNTARLAPPRVFRWEKIMLDPWYKGEEFMDPSVCNCINTDMSGNCISTAERTNGAAAVFFPGVAERLAELLGGGFYLAFTSCHEVMVHSEKAADADMLKEVLLATLETNTTEEERLTDYIYYYDPETGEFNCVK